MPKRRTIFSLIREAWKFYRKQPALNAVLLWLIIAPAVAADLLGRYAEPGSAIAPGIGGTILQILLLLLLALLGYWGSASILLVGRRMIQQRAGRGRTSFTAVRRAASPLVWPLFLTSVLRACITFYWSLLFVLPALLLVLLEKACGDLLPRLFALAAGAGSLQTLQALPRCWPLLLSPLLLLPAAWYGLRTSYYPLAVAADGKAYREGLRRSKDMIDGRFWRVVGTLAALVFLLLLPTELLSSLVIGLADAIDPRLEPAALVAAEGFSAIGMLLFTLSSIAYYGWLREKRNLPVEITPEDLTDEKE